MSAEQEEVMMDVKYPGISVRLTDEDGNAFAILGRVIKSLRNAGVDQTEIDKFRKDAMGGNYDHLLQTCMRWVDCR